MRTLIAALLAGVYACTCAAAADKNDAKAKILAAIQSTDIHTEGSQPFRLEARIRLTFDKPREGTYTLLWASPERWREEMQFPGYKQTWVRNGGQQWVSRSLSYPPLRVQQLERLLGIKVPVSAEKVDIKHVERRKEHDRELDCAKVVSKDANHEEPLKEEFCVDASTATPVRRKSTPEHGNESPASELEDYSAFGNKQFPRTLRLVEDGKPFVEAWVDRLEPATPEPSSFSALQGVDAWPTCNNAKHPEATYQPDPAYTPEARSKGIQGSAYLYLLVESDGSVKKTAVLQSLEPNLDQRAQEAVRSWKFKPARCGDLPVPAELTVVVSFQFY